MMVGRRIRTVLALVSLLSGVCLCGGASFGVERALADVLPVTTSLTGGTFTATFSGDDAGFSFAVDTSSLVSFTTGGGSITLTSGGKGSFGLVGGVQPDGTIRGHLVWMNHDIGLSVQSTSITAFTPGCTGTISGNGNSNAGPVNFVVTVTDNGEPGSNDSFSIQVVGAVSDSEVGILEGGDIQAHGLTCP